MKKNQRSFEVYKGKIRRQTILAENQLAYINLLSVYDMLLCEKMAKCFTKELIENEQFDIQYAKTVAENACLCCLCLTDEHSEAIFASTDELIKVLSAEDMLSVVKEYCALRKDYLGFDKLNDTTLNELKKKLSASFERVRWEVLKKFNKLPSEISVKNMTEYDYIYCYANMLLDEDSRQKTYYTEASKNLSFDEEKYIRESAVYIDDF